MFGPLLFVVRGVNAAVGVAGRTKPAAMYCLIKLLYQASWQEQEMQEGQPVGPQMQTTPKGSMQKPT